MNTNIKHISTVLLIAALCLLSATAVFAQPGNDPEVPPGVPSSTPQPGSNNPTPQPSGTQQLPPDLIGLTSTPPINQPSDPDATEAPPDHLVTSVPPIVTEDVVTAEPTLQTQTPQPTPVSVPVVEDNTDASFTPEFKWMLTTDSSGILIAPDYYNVVVVKDQVVLIDEWMRYAEICFINECAYTPEESALVGGFVNGNYEWWVRSYTMQNGITSDWSARQTFNVNLPAPQVPSPTVTETQGRLSVSWNDDPYMTWFQVYIGMEDGKASLIQWFEKDASICDGSSCTLQPAVNFPTGRYTVSIQAWGPGGFSRGGVDGWATPVMARVGNPAPDLAANLQVTADNGQTTLTWAHSEGASQYQVWVGTADLTAAHMEWHAAADLNCESGLCSLNITPALTSNVTYQWYVLANNAAGNAIGGTAGWATGPSFTAP